MSESPFSFKLDFPDDYADPLLPRSKAFHIAFYPKYVPEFYDIVKECAELIDKLYKTEDRIMYTNQLSRIFIVRHKDEAMQLLKRLTKKYNHTKGR